MKVKDVLYKVITARYSLYIFVPFLLLAVAFAVAWPALQGLIKNVNLWRDMSWGTRLRAIPRMLIQVLAGILAGIWDILVNWIPASWLHREGAWNLPKGKKVFLTQRYQHYFDHWDNKSHRFGDKQRFVMKWSAFIANLFDTSPHFTNIPDELKVSGKLANWIISKLG